MIAAALTILYLPTTTITTDILNARGDPDKGCFGLLLLKYSTALLADRGDIV